jgi:phosphoribosylformylglycinamidine synthase
MLRSMPVQFFPGRPAFSPARLSKRLARAREDNPGITDVRARFVHLADLTTELDERGRAVLARVLEYGPRIDLPPLDGVRLWVVPRFGTISPWSSKATDIAHLCGLAAVRRLERGVEWTVAGAVRDEAALRRALHDRMTESVLAGLEEGARLFERHEPRPLTTVPLDRIEEANRSLGLALLEPEIEYLKRVFRDLGRDPTDVELTMFGQANSEHCRHKIFNAELIVDGAPQPDSLFRMIRRSTEAAPDGVLSAYHDNAAVVEGPVAGRFFPEPGSAVYRAHREPVHLVMKVETHNHPTAISPYPGASTGSGGEIRDEGATGRGAKPKAGLVGFSVSNLRLPGAVQPWERDYGRPGRIVSALDIMIDGPLGGAGFNNEFGRPALCGYFRTFELEVGGVVRGYHKPIMIAGGLGNIRAEHVEKGEIPPGAAIVVLGGPAMLIGLGGGAASSMATGTSHEELDFASVQRDNAEMERRCQEVIDRCWALGERNPIVSIHDCGAGGLSNALPELVHESRRGARFDLRKVPNDEPGMTPREVWCNESQERYVLAIPAERLPEFEALCRRERCPFAVLGHATVDERLVVEDPVFANRPVDMPLPALLGKVPRMRREVTRRAPPRQDLDVAQLELHEALLRVLRLPAVADKTFLVTIGDRTVTGQVSRDQMVGPWQVPVADAAVTITSYDTVTGEAMAMGERTPVAVLDAAAAARLAVAEAVTNIASAPIASLGLVRLSANWMAAAGHPGEDARLFEAVRAVGAELCPALGIAVPVGKDSLSMRTVWTERGAPRSVVSPVSLIVSAFAPVTDVRGALTPELRRDQGPTELLLVDLGRGRNRLGGSALLLVHGAIGVEPPDLDDPALLRGLFAAVQELRGAGLLLAYHDRSDGGLVVTLLEMAFAGATGLEIELDQVRGAPGVSPPAPPRSSDLAALFAEELGAVLQVRAAEVPRVLEVLAAHGLAGCVQRVGRPVAGDRILIRGGGLVLVDEKRSFLRGIWSETTWRLQRLRDDPACADEEQGIRCDPDDPGLTLKATFDLAGDPAPGDPAEIPGPGLAPAPMAGANPGPGPAPMAGANPGPGPAPMAGASPGPGPAPMAGASPGPDPSRTGARPRVAVLREQGVNGQVEMAAAFDRAGFDAVDVHMSDLLEGRLGLDGFAGLAACGGFSYGDVLGAGEGWAKSALFHERARAEFARFFARPDTFALGVCNGCQMLSNLRELIPGTEAWPRFVRNRSEQFEARLSLVRVEPGPSVLLAGMAGSLLPIAVAHGEGRAEFADAAQQAALERAGLVCARFVDPHGRPTERYPHNPNGSPGGITAVTTPDGRFTALMPHPERVFRTVQLSWHPAGLGEDSPWMRLFRNARAFVG